MGYQQKYIIMYVVRVISGNMENLKVNFDVLGWFTIIIQI